VYATVLWIIGVRGNSVLRETAQRKRDTSRNEGNERTIIDVMYLCLFYMGVRCYGNE